MNNKEIRILLVEDEVITAMYIKMELQKSGYKQVKNIGSGEKAIEIAYVERPEIILMDINLSGEMNGIEAAREILLIYTPQIIFMTGYHDDEAIKEISRINASKHVNKPVEMPRIVELIQGTKPSLRNECP